MSPILWAIWSQEASFSRNNLTPVRRTRQPPANWTRQGWAEDRLKAELRTNFQTRRNPVGSFALTRQEWVEDRLKAELRTNFQTRRNPVGGSALTRQEWVEDRLKAELRTNFQARRNPVGVREAPFHCICSLAPLAGFRGRRPRSPQGQRVRVRG